MLRKYVAVVGCLLLAVLSGCMTSSRISPAPIEDRQRTAQPPKTRSAPAPSNTTTAHQAAVPAPPVPAPVAPDNTVKSAYYVVKPGDTLIRIGLDHGQNWRDIIRWNSIDNPNVIEVGQVLRVLPPLVDNTAEQVVVKPVTAPSQIVNTTPDTKSSPGNPPPPASSPSTPENTEENTVFFWPATGNVNATFDELKNKGIDISGKTGDPVYASADGRVVYAGAGLRGYGNLVIVKHPNNYLTAYAHNQTLLVREDQSVKRGQKIAEMGNSDSEQVKLHFEIRKQGKPVDPVKLLPAR